MHDPEFNDNYHEWIELYNPTNKTINLSGWSITDNTEKDHLEKNLDHGNGSTLLPSRKYAIITDNGTKIYEKTNFSNDTIKLYVEDASIGNGLSEEDKLILKNKSNTIIDSVEWGKNYEDVPGKPIFSEREGVSLARKNSIDTDNTSKDFVENKDPTPGNRNKIDFLPNLSIDLYPKYIPKIENNLGYSTAFAIKVNVTGFQSYKKYQMKSYIVGNKTNIWPASQTWNGHRWIYSYQYIDRIKTNENGSWKGWIYLRFKKDYKEYQENIKNKNSCFLNIKVRNDSYSSKISKKIFLLDIDYNSSNGTLGGYVVGRAKINNSFVENEIILVENKTNEITGLYVTENNEIDEGLTSKNGYFKIPSPVGKNNKIKILDEKADKTTLLKENVSIEQGTYKVKIWSKKSLFRIGMHKNSTIPIVIKNQGDFKDNFTLDLKSDKVDWNIFLNNDEADLKPGENNTVKLFVPSCKNCGFKKANITITATSKNDIGVHDKVQISVEYEGPDLIIKKIKIYGSDKNEEKNFGEGEKVRIKAFLKNIGNINATNVNVSFYYQQGDKTYLIGKKHYESVSRYQKYPSVVWETQNLNPGLKNILVVADKEEQVDELNEYNNLKKCKIQIYNTTPKIKEQQVLINEVYYHNHPNIKNEYIGIYNPSDVKVNLSGWFLTNQPLKDKDKQTKIIFPDSTCINPKEQFIITQNGSAYNWETNGKPDFEYNVNSKENIPQMIADKTFVMSNQGETVALKDSYNHTIDIAIYGEKNITLDKWNGENIPASGEGNILKRRKKGNIFVDTDTCTDWIQPRIFGIGQSNFNFNNISTHGNITTFVSPDCSFEAIVNEIRKANNTIYMNMYEFDHPFLCDEIISAIKRNVTVNIFVEGSPVGGISDQEKYVLNRIASYGGNIQVLHKDKSKNIFSRYTFNHGKYLILDNKTVIIESCNWAETGVPKNPSFGNREWGTIIRNMEVTQNFLDIFLEDWNPERCDSCSIDQIGNMNIPYDFYIDKNVYTGGKYEPQFSPMTVKDNFTAKTVISPDNSYSSLMNLIESANKSIYIEQLYIYKNWSGQTNPFLKQLIEKAEENIDIKVILNYNPSYESSIKKCKQTKEFLEENNISVKFFYTNWSYFTNIHTKGVVIDNRSVFVGSINWNENSVKNNREVGIILKNKKVANYYTESFLYDWKLSPKQYNAKLEKNEINFDYLNENTIYIVAIYVLTFLFVLQDWRKREWR